MFKYQKKWDTNLIILQRSKSISGIAYHKTGPEDGLGPVLLFVHGVGLRAESWGPQIDRFKSSYQVYAIDMPGHGQSDPLEGEPELHDYVMRIASFIWEEFDQPVIIIGHSLGALIAAEIAARYNDICCGAVAISAIYQRTDEALAAVKARAAFIKANPDQDLAIGPVARWFEDTACDDAQLCTDMIKSNSGAGYGAAYSAFANSRGVDPELLRNTERPILFLTGEGDGNSSPDMSKKLSETAPFGSLSIIKDAKHMVPLSHAKEVGDALASFFETVNGSNQGSTRHANNEIGKL